MPVNRQNNIIIPDNSLNFPYPFYDASINKAPLKNPFDTANVPVFNNIQISVPIIWVSGLDTTNKNTTNNKNLEKIPTLINIKV